MKYRALNCELYDFIETICMYHSFLELQTVDGVNIKAIALTTKTTANKEEYLQLESPGFIQEVRLDMISVITLLDGSSNGQRKEFTSRPDNDVCVPDSHER